MQKLIILKVEATIENSHDNIKFLETLYGYLVGNMKNNPQLTECVGPIRSGVRAALSEIVGEEQMAITDKMLNDFLSNPLTSLKTEQLKEMVLEATLEINSSGN